MLGYLSVPTSVTLGNVPIGQLTNWRAAITDKPMAASDRLHDAWLSVEVGASLITQSQKDETDSSSILPVAQRHLDQAQNAFSEIANDPKADIQLQVKALLALGNIPAFRTILSGDHKYFIEECDILYDTQFTATEMLLRHIKRFPGVRYRHLLHALGATVAINFGNPHGSREDITYALQAPSRAQQSNNLPDAPPIALWHVYRPDTTLPLSPLRVAATSTLDAPHISPALLFNRQYPSDHGQGTLQAYVDFKKTRRKDMRFQAHRHLLDANIRILGDIKEKVGLGSQNNSVADPKDTERAVSIYLEMLPELHSARINREELEALAADLEMRLHNNELAPTEQLALAWMHVESGLLGALTGAPRAADKMAFGHAEDILGDLLEKITESPTQPEGQALAPFSISIDQASTEIYGALAIPDSEEDQEETINQYIQRLAGLADSMLDQYDNAPDQASLPESLKQSLHTMTLMLTAMKQIGGTHVAAASLLRQRHAMPKARPGSWDVSIWPQTPAGFNANYLGKARVSEQDDLSSLDMDVVTFSYALLNPDGNFGILRYLTRDYEGAPGQAPKMEKALQKIIDRILQTTESIP